jgi:hypothetical protein
MILNSPTISGSLTVTGNIIASGSITLSGSIASASYADTASFVALAQSASNAVSAATASFANAFTVASTLTAQTLVVQTITSSVDFVTGSTRFGSLLGNTHVFSGSVTMNPGGLFVSSSGLVGIGTTSPASLLSIGGATSQGSLLTYTPSQARQGFFNTYYSNSEGLFPQYLDIVSYGQPDGTNGGGVIRFLTNPVTNSSAAVERMRVTSTGNVGVGTSSPAARLVVVEGGGSGAPLMRFIGNVGNGEYMRTTWLTSTGTELAFLNVDGSVSMNFGTVSSTPLTLNTANTERMRITSAGIVGIGTSSPLGPLEVRAANRVTSADGILQINTTNSQAIDLGGCLSFGGMYENSGTIPTEWAQIAGRKENSTAGVYSGYLQFSTRPSGGANTERMRITSGGTVLIGTATTDAFGARLLITGRTDTYNLLSIQDTGPASAGVYYVVFWNSAGSLAGGIQHITTSTVNYYTGPSDQRLKSNIKNVEEPVLPLFNNAKLKTYNHIADKDESVVYKGFLAQDMVGNFPEAYGKDKDGYYTFNPSGYIPYLVKAIQELKTQNDALQSRIETLESK